MMNKFDCQDVLAVLSGLLDGELDSEMLHLAEVHLNECVQCRDMLEQAEQQDALAQAAMGSFESWPEDLERNIWTLTHGPAQAIVVEQRLRLAAWAGWITAAAACLVAGVLLIFGNKPLVDLSGSGIQFAHDNSTVKLQPQAKDNINNQDEIINNSSVPGITKVGNNNNHNKVITKVPTQVIPDRENKQMIHMFITPGRIRVVFINPALRIPGQMQPQHIDGYANNNILDNPQTQRVARTNNSYLQNAAVVYDQFDNEVGNNVYNQPFTNDEMFAVMENMAVNHMIAAHYNAANRNNSSLRPSGITVTTNALASRNAIHNLSDNSLNQNLQQPQQQMALVKYGDNEWTVSMEDDFYHASVLLNLLAEADDTSFEDVHMIREVLENEDLLDRLADSRAMLGQADAFIINQAWTALEWVNGPVDQKNLHKIQDKIKQADLADRIEELSNREWK